MQAVRIWMKFMQYSKHSFRNLIRSDEQEAVEKASGSRFGLKPPNE